MMVRTSICRALFHYQILTFDDVFAEVVFAEYHGYDALQRQGWKFTREVSLVRVRCFHHESTHDMRFAAGG